MKSSYIHIVMGESAFGSLTYFLKNNISNNYYGKVINFTDNLQLGSIYNFENNINERAEVFCKFFSGIEFMYEDTEKFIKEEFSNLYNDELNISNENKIIIWYGNNTNEELMLRYLVNRFNENIIYEVAISEVVTRKFEGYNNARAVAECSPEELGKALEQITTLDNEEGVSLIAEWNSLTKTKEVLRILEGNKIVSVDESYFDNRIIQYTTEDFIEATRVIGEVMGTSEELIGDTFLYYRVRKLIENNKLKYKGKIGCLGNLKIKLKV